MRSANLGRIGAGLEDGNRLQIVGIGLKFPLQHFADGVMVMGVIARHRFEIGERRCLRPVGLERLCALSGFCEVNIAASSKRLG